MRHRKTIADVLDKQSLRRKFLSKVTTLENGCQIWSGSIGFSGYGQLSFEGRSWSTHRLAYEIANGPISQDAEKWWVLHRCDNPACCNPEHLYLGDAKDNANDMIDRKRQRMGFKRHGRGESIRFGRVFYEIGGEIKTIFEWAEFFDVHPSTLEQRIAAGWPEKDLCLSSKVYKRHLKSEGQTKYKRFSGLKEVEDYKNETPVAVTTEASISTNRDGNIDMTNLSVNHPICNNPVVIADVSIHQDTEGRFSLNDLHKSAGGEQRHQPRYWLALQQTTEMIDEVINSGITLFHPLSKRMGCKGGTYVCKELVYSYAMWISAAFALKVIRAYDALVTGDVEKAQQIAETTVDDRTPLRGIVNRIMGKYGMTYQAVYKLVHKEFGVKHIDELTPRQTSEAIEYLAGKVIEGEFLGKERAQLKLPLSYPMEYFNQYSHVRGLSERALSAPWRYPADMLIPNGDNPNPLGRMLGELKNMGCEVDAALFQLLSLQHHLESLRSKISSIQRAVM